MSPVTRCDKIEDACSACRADTSDTLITPQGGETFLHITNQLKQNSLQLETLMILMHKRHHWVKDKYEDELCVGGACFG
ncbi:hypothetical protein E2C01_082137 [Portunus trituberculatus]|uniref:Uncharacterized protein n=1 Tax=Portunus trituberculatus TaxID=210409 RepID=A0A5B7IYA3_PORTR|nr:hypothetical protein [Portunus trituberculatus]